MPTKTKKHNTGKVQTFEKLYSLSKDEHSDLIIKCVKPYVDFVKNDKFPDNDFKKKILSTYDNMELLLKQEINIDSLMKDSVELRKFSNHFSEIERNSGNTKRIDNSMAKELSVDMKPFFKEKFNIEISDADNDSINKKYLEINSDILRGILRQEFNKSGTFETNRASMYMAITVAYSIECIGNTYPNIAYEYVYSNILKDYECVTGWAGLDIKNYDISIKDYVVNTYYKS
jgi:hypothetical protein